MKRRDFFSSSAAAITGICIPQSQPIVDQPIIADRNGLEIKVGQTVLIHTKLDDPQEAVVDRLFPDSPTVNEPGYWVDVRIGNRGSQGMPSYLLEVVKYIPCPATD